MSTSTILALTLKPTVDGTEIIEISENGTGSFRTTLSAIVANYQLLSEKGAVNGYAGLDASQKLLLTNFPTGTGLQILRRNAGNTALEFATISTGGITSINGDTTAAQILAGTANRITINDAGATHTFDIGTDIVTINGIQTLTNKSIVATQLTGTIEVARLPEVLPVTLNTDIVDVSGYSAFTDTQNGEFNSGTTTDIAIINREHDSIIRQSGTVDKVRLVTGSEITDSSLTGFFVSVWREGGGTFTQIGSESENILSAMQSAGVSTDVTITLSTKIQGVKEGDFTVYRTTKTGIIAKQVVGRNPATSTVGAQVLFGTLSSPFNWDSGTSDSANYVRMQLLMQAPSAIAFGDSLTSGSTGHSSYANETGTVNDPSKSYPFKLFESLGLNFQNMGINGDTSTGADARITEDVINKKPKFCILWIGTNDVSGGVAQGTFETNYTSMLTKLQTAGIITICVLIAPRTSLSDAQQATRVIFNDFIRTEADTFNTFVVDLESVVGQRRTTVDEFNNWDINSTLNVGDNTHFTELGYSIVADAIYLIIQNNTISDDTIKLFGIATGAEVNPDLISQAEAEAGTSTTERIFSALRVAQAIAALAGGSGLTDLNGLTAATQTFAVGQADELTISSVTATHTFSIGANIPRLDEAQTFTGINQFTNTFDNTLFAQKTTTLTNTIGLPFRIEHKTSGVMVDGFGVGINFVGDDGAPLTFGKLIFQRDGADDKGKFVVNNNENGPVNTLTIDNTGLVDWPQALAHTGIKIDANGTGNAITNIDVADLANGVDGELITWDAAGAPATVGVGTSSQVLTSNGPGTAPTFQANPAGFTDPMTTRGDIIIRNPSNVTDRLAIGANTFVLTSDGTDISWSAAGAASLPVVDTTSIVEGSADATKELRFEVDGNTTGIIGVLATIFTTAKTLTFPDATDTLMGKATTDVMTNKTESVDLNSIIQDTPATGEYLRDNGTKFVGSAILAGDLPSAIDATKIADGTVTSTEFQFINTLTSNAQTQINTKLSSGLATSQIFVGNGGSVATGVTMSNDATISSIGALTIANNAITLAKMAGGTDGNLITYDSSGDPAFVTTGTSGQVLTSNGAGTAPTFQAAGAASLPVVDTTSIVEGSADATKEMRFEVDGFTTSTIRVITPPDADINLPGTNIANTFTALQTFNLGVTLASGQILELDSDATEAAFHDAGHTADPSSPLAGNLYYNTTSNVFRFYNGTVWGGFGGGDTVVGTQVMELDASALYVGGTVPAVGLVTKQFGAQNQPIRGIEMSDGANQEVYAQFKLNNWNEGTIKIKAYWFVENDIATPESKTFELDCSGVSLANFAAIGGTAYGTAITITDTTDSSSAEDKINISPASADITIAGAGEGEWVSIKMVRDAATDTAGTVFLTGISIEYTIASGTGTI